MAVYSSKPLIASTRPAAENNFALHRGGVGLYAFSSIGAHVLKAAVVLCSRTVRSLTAILAMETWVASASPYLSGKFASAHHRLGSAGAVAATLTLVAIRSTIYVLVCYRTWRLTA